MCACVRVCISHSEQQAEELVSELVFSFLIPEVQRIGVRQKGPAIKPTTSFHLHHQNTEIHPGGFYCGGPLGPDTRDTGFTQTQSLRG